MWTCKKFTPRHWKKLPEDPFCQNPIVSTPNSALSAAQKLDLLGKYVISSPFWGTHFRPGFKKCALGPNSKESIWADTSVVKDSRYEF